MEKTINIKTINKPLCPICGQEGVFIYQNLTDTLFKTPGAWSARKCGNNNCKTYWLDPAPATDDLGKLYVNYTTHASPPQEEIKKRRGLRRLLDAICESVLAQELGYKSNLSIPVQKILSTIAKIHPGWCDEKKNQVLYVPFIPHGHLLDVGCGAGHGMQTMERYGWKTTGTDFDAVAVDYAKSKGFDAYFGELEDQNFSDNYFDAILLSHVIEHVPDPIAIIQECHRILKPNGHLIIITPNINSTGHEQYAKDWRGLEVPRHLQIFTPSSLTLLGKKANFRYSSGSTCLQGLYYIRDASRIHKKTGSFDLKPKDTFDKIVDKGRLFWAGIKFSIKPGKEETALLHCQK